MKKTLSICIVVLFSLHPRAQLIHYPVASPGLYAAQFGPGVTGPFTCAFNPAALADLNSFSMGIYTENRYAMNELNLILLSAAVNRNDNGLSLLFQYFGSARYNEKHFGLNYGRSLGKVRLGALFNYQLFNIAGSAPMSLFRFGVASIWKISDQFYTGFQFFNPHFIIAQNKNGIRSPAEYHIGMGFQASAKLYLGFESEKTEARPPSVIFAMKYQFADKFYLRGCWTTGNNEPFLSTGLIWKQFRIESGFGYHQILGISPSLLLIYQNAHEENK